MIKEQKPRKVFIFALAIIFFLGLGGLGLWRHQTAWAIYQNQNYGVRMNYPPEYFLVEKGGGIYLKKEGDKTLLYLKVLDNPQAWSAQEWFDHQCDCKTDPLLKSHRLAKVKVNGYEALKLIEKESGVLQDFLVIIAAQSKIYHFSFSIRKEEAELSPKILSSLRFF